MYKKDRKKRLEKSRHPLQIIRRKMTLIIMAFMIGMSNIISEEDRTVLGNKTRIEQEDKRE
jgi:hypothetical protein